MMNFFEAVEVLLAVAVVIAFAWPSLYDWYKNRKRQYLRFAAKCKFSKPIAEDLSAIWSGFTSYCGKKVGQFLRFVWWWSSTPEDKVVGAYEVKVGGNTVRMVLLENGIFEGYVNDEQDLEEGKWSISEEGEIHGVDEDGDIGVFRINEDGDITWIAEIDTEGKRTDFPKQHKRTLKKLKE